MQPVNPNWSDMISSYHNNIDTDLNLLLPFGDLVKLPSQYTTPCCDLDGENAVSVTSRLMKHSRLTPVVFLITKPSPTPSFFPKFATTPSQTEENSSSFDIQASPSFRPSLSVPNAIPVLTFPGPKYSALEFCKSSKAEQS